MMRQSVTFALLIAAWCGMPAAASDAVREMVEITAGQAVLVKPDKAYLLLRIPRYNGVPTFEPLLLRVPTAAEIQRYEADRQRAFEAALPALQVAYAKASKKRADALAAGRRPSGEAAPPPSVDRFAFAWPETNNLQNIEAKRAFAQNAGEATYLVEVPPGDYVVYGASWSGGLASVHVCFCLGTVGFVADAGRVTDLGYFMADRAKSVSVIPELAAESGFGPSSDAGGNFLLTGTIRPVRTDSSHPVALPSAAVPARYRAVGKFVAPGAIGINRLVPIPGILDYARGDVIDTQSKTVAVDRF